MGCRVCGDEKATYRAKSLQVLCESCAADTPFKVSRPAFDRAYRGGDMTIPESTRREFYDDYLTSSHTLREYINATTQSIGG